MHIYNAILIKTAARHELDDDAVVQKILDTRLPSPDNGGVWYDWWQYGGRWDGWFQKETEKVMWPNMLTNPNVIPLSETAAAIKMLETIIEHRRQIGAWRREESDKVLQALLDSEQYMDIEEIPELTSGTWPLSAVFDALGGRWIPESHYYDPYEHSADPRPLLKHLKGETPAYPAYGAPIDLDRTALVCVDFHY